MVKKTTVKCPKCKGQGAVQLSNTLLETFNMVIRFDSKRGLTATDARFVLECEELGITAFNNRLEKLLHLDLIRRVRKGKQWAYFLYPQNKGVK